MGAHEVLLDESLQLGGAIKDCRVVVFEDMWHDFFLYSRAAASLAKNWRKLNMCIDIVSKFVADTSAAAAGAAGGRADEGVATTTRRR